MASKVLSKRGQKSSGSSAGSESDPKSPVTIAMTLEVLFRKEQQSNGSLTRGPAFFFVKALQAVNDKLQELYPNSEERFKVILFDDSSSDSLEREIKDNGLEELITVLPVSKEELISELQKSNTRLYLTDEPGLAEEAVNAGIATGIISTPKTNIQVSEDKLHLAFDGDAVLFSNESELQFQRAGLLGFLEHEKEKVELPMPEGPFKGFLEALIKLQKKFHAKGRHEDCPIRTYLVTSRSAGCGGYRALNTLHRWGLEIDEAVFVGGSKKGPTLEKIKPHIFFDDQKSHVDAALKAGTVGCLVPSPKKKKRN